jgi:hypothetical protein
MWGVRQSPGVVSPAGIQSEAVKYSEQNGFRLHANAINVPADSVGRRPVTVCPFGIVYALPVVVGVTLLQLAQLVRASVAGAAQSGNALNCTDHGP